jgi:hypothetical protein
MTTWPANTLANRAPPKTPAHLGYANILLALGKDERLLKFKDR